MKASDVPVSVPKVVDKLNENTYTTITIEKQ